MPKAFVTGATGLLGRAVFKSFQVGNWEVFGTGLSRASGNGIFKLDLLDRDAVQNMIENQKCFCPRTLDNPSTSEENFQEVRNIKLCYADVWLRPDIIVHSAADRSPDSVAANPELARSLNVDATSYLTTIASSLGIPLLYISTDYVFPGVPGEAPYLESATPRATNLYGQLKLDGEKAVVEAGSSPNGTTLGAVLRVPVLYGHVDPSVGNKESAVNVLVDKVHECAKGKKVVMDDWAKRYPTNVEDIGNGIVKLAEKWLETMKASENGRQGFPRVLQFSGKECLTKYEMCQTFAQILGVDIETMERDAEGGGGGGGGVQRPFNTQLATGEFERVLGGELRTVSFKDWWNQELLS